MHIIFKLKFIIIQIYFNLLKLRVILLELCNFGEK